MIHIWTACTFRWERIYSLHIIYIFYSTSLQCPSSAARARSSHSSVMLRPPCLPSGLPLRECFPRDALILQALSGEDCTRRPLLVRVRSACGVSSGWFGALASRSSSPYGRLLPAWAHLEFIQPISSCCCKKCKLRRTWGGDRGLGGSE